MSNKEEKMLVSIICVTFNAEKYIGNFLESVKQFKPQNCELIVFDGLSTDETVKIAKSYGDLVNQLVIEKDNGIYDAMNKAVKLAQGKWLYFIGADDELLPDFSKFVLQLKDPETIFHGNILMDNETIVRSADAYRLAKENISHQTIFYPASVFKKYNYDERYPICADYDLNLRLRGNKAYKFEYIPLTPAKFGVDGLSSSKKDILFESKKAAIVLRNIGFYVYFRLIFKEFKLNQNKKRAND